MSPRVWAVCQDCRIPLDATNRVSDDPYAAFCKDCWSKTLPWEPVCGLCGTGLVQDSANLARIYCPLCNVLAINLRAES